MKEKFLENKIKTLANGKQVIEMPNSVNFIIVTNDDYVILPKQYRASTDSEMLNSFGGYVDNGETYEEAIIRECKEESNVDVSPCDITYIYKEKLVSAGYTTERNTLAIVWENKSVDKIDLKCNDKEEGITIEKLRVRKFSKMHFDGLKIHLLRAYMG